MQNVCTGEHPPSATIQMLPILDLNPSNETCIYSTLLFVQEQAEQLNIVTPCVTFDQPLYIKADDIIKSATLNVIVRLGGFHTLMSFLGSIGCLIGGSGLEDIFELNYCPQTVGHILNGKAVSIAIHAHFLLEAALMIKLGQFIEPLSYKVLEYNSTYDNISSNPDEFLSEQDIKEICSICETVEQNKVDVMNCGILACKSVPISIHPFEN